MIKKIVLTSSFLVFIILVTGFAISRWYLKIGQKSPLDSNTPIFVEKANVSTLESDSSAASRALDKNSYSIETFAEGLDVPWSIVFTDEHRILVTQRPGQIKAVIDGKLQDQPLKTFSEVSHTMEEGLLGLALDPDYSSTKFLYVCLTYSEGSELYDKVVKLKDEQTSLSDQATLIDKIPAARFHAGCRVKFGPDKKLYITTGDATKKDSAQDTAQLSGKILRLNSDGTIPADNPFPNSAVFSYGHRNPQGLDWHPVSQALMESEHGPTGTDGPGGGDEINYIEKGKNYGWPVISHDKTKAGLENPLIVFTPAVAPASGMFYSGDALPQFRNNFLVGLLKGEGILRVVVSDTTPPKIIMYEKVPNVQFGRIRDMVEGPDGFIYFTTSNKDGRGKARTGDDKIMRIVPKS